MHHLVRPFAAAAVLAIVSGTADAQLFGRTGQPNRFVTVTTALDASASEAYAIDPGIGGHVCYPATPPVPGRLCSDLDSLRGSTPGETLSVHADIRPPIDSERTALVASDAFSRQALDVSGSGDLRRFEVELFASHSIIGPNAGTMTASGSSSVTAGFRTQSLLRPTSGHIQGTLRVRASDPANPFFNPPYRPGLTMVSVVLRRDGSAPDAPPLFARDLSTDASADEPIELVIDETLTVANGRYTLTVTSSGQVVHFGGGFAGAAFGRRSLAESAAQLVLTLDNASLRR